MVITVQDATPPWEKDAPDEASGRATLSPGDELAVRQWEGGDEGALELVAAIQPMPDDQRPFAPKVPSKSLEIVTSSIYPEVPTVDDLPLTAYRASDLDVLADRPVDFLVRGFLARDTFGMFGGAQKTLKTELQIALDLSIVSGVPFLGHDRFTVKRTGPVLTFVGEGGLAPYMRRVRRTATAYGIEIPDDYIISDVLGDMSDPSFIKKVAQTVDAVDPLLVRIDPYYAYHGGDTEATNLFQQGMLLSRFATAVAGRTFLLTHHFNESGHGLGLERFTQAGSAQWVDSWVQVVHRETPDPERGVFKLGMKVGSRQWGERLYEVDVALGRFDMDAGHHDGIPTWQVRQVDYSAIERWGKGARKAAKDLGREIIEALLSNPSTLTRSKLIDHVGGKAEVVRRSIDELVANGHVLSLPVKFTDSVGRAQTHSVLGIAPEAPPTLHGVEIPITYQAPPTETP